MIKTEIFLGYQKPQGAIATYVVFTMQDYSPGGQVSTYESKISRQGIDEFFEEVTQVSEKKSLTSNFRSNTRDILARYGGFIGSRILGFL